MGGLEKLTVCLAALFAARFFGGCGGSDESPQKHANDAGSDGSGGSVSDAMPDSAASCGNGVVESGEECDEGAKNGAGTGCEKDCRASCASSADCDDQKPCNGVESCEPLGSGRACKAGVPLAENSACGQSGYCKSGVCTEPVCGDAEVEPGEACDPPNPPACSASCQICGDGVIGKGEQCDDKNALNLDGCDSTCRYETIMRLTYLDVRTTSAPSFCVHTKNAFGSAFADEVALQLGKSIAAATDGGANNMLLDFVGLDDLTGQTAASVGLGLIASKLDPRYASQWVPKAVDGWFLAQPEMLDALGKPIELFTPASISSYLLSAGPCALTMQVISGTTTNAFKSKDTTIRATIDQSPAPNVPAPPPAALAAGLNVFQSLTATGPDQGLCGALTVESLAGVAAPQDLTLGANACSPNCTNSHAYTDCGPGQPVGPNCHSLLDVLVGGCKVTALCIPAILPTQPDVGSASNPPATLTTDANNKVLVTVPTDGYSFYSGFSANRAHLTNNYVSP